MKTTHKRITVITLLSVSILVNSSCKKFVDINPPINQITGDEAFKNDASATAIVTGIYSEMMNNPAQFSSGFTTLYAGMCADELYYYSSGNNDEFVTNQISLSNHGLIGSSFWQPAYKYIYTANLVIEKLNKADLLSANVKRRLEGEAKFIRAFCYFQLVNLFGDVPLITGTNYHINSTIPRTSTNIIYQQIISDLRDASGLLSLTYVTADRVRPNRWAAEGLLARVYLYTGEWLKSEESASLVIQSPLYSLPANLNNVFLKNSSEALWQLQPVNPSWNTWEGNIILPASSASLPTYLLTPNLLQAFETGDPRKASWTNTRTYAGTTVVYPYKYKVYGNGAPLTEFYMILRLAEQYLIRAEARAKQNNTSGAQADLNIIRNRSTLANTTANTQTDLLSAIERERRIELFAEWGHRWYDLKRTGRADVLLSVLKPGTWQSTDKLWPIPVSELNANPHLIQNPGY